MKRVVSIIFLNMLVSFGPSCVEAQQGAASGPTLEQTLQFVNETFATEGAFDYTNGTGGCVHERYVGYANTLYYKRKIVSQLVTMDGNALVYTSKAIKVTIDKSPELKRNGEVINQNRLDHPVIKEDPDDEQQLINLATTKDLTVVVSENMVLTLNCFMHPDDAPVTDTSPKTYSVAIVIPPADVRGSATSIVVGTFFDPDHANRVVKAYTHAIDLLHKHVDKSPSLF